MLPPFSVDTTKKFYQFNFFSGKYMPYSCERNIKIESEEDNVGMYEFVYNFNEWEQIKEKNKTECYYHVKQSSKINRMYNLELDFETNVTDMSHLRNHCFFQVFLYTGRQDHNSPMKVGSFFNLNYDDFEIKKQLSCKDR